MVTINAAREAAQHSLTSEREEAEVRIAAAREATELALTELNRDLSENTGYADPY